MAESTKLDKNGLYAGSREAEPATSAGPPGAASAMMQKKIARRRAARTGTENPSTTAQRVVEEFAPRLGLAPSEVEVNTGELGEARASAHGTPAVTIGNRIFLGNAVAPATPEGKHVIAHELAHVVHQTHPVSIHASAGATSPASSNALEQEANQAGSLVVAGGNAKPQLRTAQATAQGYDSPEHLDMGSNVHSVLDPVVLDNATAEFDNGTCQDPRLGGVSENDIEIQTANEKNADGASHSPGLGTVAEATKGDGSVAMPQLAAMLQRDEALKQMREDGTRNFSISARNYEMRSDAAGPYLALEIDPSTKQAARYDVPVSLGDMTALNGDLYGSVENMRKAPASEIIAMRNMVERESRWEADIATGKRDGKDEPNFDSLYEQATAWRHQPVYAAGRQLGVQGEVAGGDKNSYFDLALHNQAHFGQPTDTRRTLEIAVKSNQLIELAHGPQGNLSDGNEQAWMAGHTRARRLAKEAYDLKNTKKSSRDHKRAANDDYGHDTSVLETGVVNQEALRVAAPKDKNVIDADGDESMNPNTLTRSSNVATYDTKLNDAYVENAGADHYLTDAFAAGHQIARSLIGDLTEQLMKAMGGHKAFLDFIVEKIQDAAIADPEHAAGKLGDFQDASRSSVKKDIARGHTILNEYGIVDGLKQQLEPRINKDGLRAIGAKLVHDYYNRNGLIVHNAKGMTFLIKGDGHVTETPEARRIIAVAVLESRNQITELATIGATGNPMDVWDYTPDEDRSQFTAESGSKILAKQFADGTYLWNLLKDDMASVTASPPPSDAKQKSEKDLTQKAIRDNTAGGGDSPDGEILDPGAPPIRQWFRARRQYLQLQVQNNSKDANRVTADGVKFKEPEAR